MAKYTWVIDTLFDKNKLFVKNSFIEFVEELTWKVVNDRDIKKSKSMDSSWNEYFKEELMIYEDKSWEKISIMIYKMPSSTKVEKARSYQRNLISSYLKNEWVFEGIDSVLCAFYSEDTSDWRLSFVKQEFKLNPETKKIINELTPAKRYSFLVESNSKNVTVKQRLNSLLESSNILVSEIEKAFSVEKVSKEFFDKYVKLYEKLVLAFKNDRVFDKIESESNNWDENFRENFVKKLLWQIVFLYFLQKKWWLWVEKWANWWTGKKDFLQSLLNECLNWWDEKKELWWKNFFNDYLEHLFYDNLNKKRENDYSEYFGYRIPYLNWWLFEPINNYNWKGFEYVVLSWDKNNALFKEIFDTFDEYNFTVYENDPLEQDVAVDPEMLGKVFENLLPENERKGKWAFYTPREIVHYMCKESLKNHIINKTWITEELCEKLFTYKDSYLNATKRWNKLLDEDKYNIFETFYEYWEKIVETLKYVKIVDPAVWSGAFPMWLLKEIVSLRKFIQENVLLQENVSEYNLKKETLENCIYGVDLDPGAVEIAKLRFWLSLVIEEDSKDNIDPLPNLDYKIMQWNSLIEDIVVWDSVIKIDLENSTKKLTKKEEKELWNAHQESLWLDFKNWENELKYVLQKLKSLHKSFFDENNAIRKQQLKNEIDWIEKKLIRISWEVEVNKIKSQIDNIEWKYIISWMAWDEKDAKKVALLYAQISSIKEMEEKYKRDSIRSFFPWKLHFWEVFNENWGFDIVIGNPPYVWEKWNKETFELIKKWNLKEFYQWKMDLLYFFFHLWLNIWKEKSQIWFITTNYYVTALWWKKLRSDFKDRAIIRKLLNLNELKIFESALWQHNIITLLEKWYNNNFISKNCITSRTWYYLNLNWWKVLDDILNGIDSETQYFEITQNNLYDWVENYVRIWWLNWKTNIDVILDKLQYWWNQLKNLKNVNNGVFTWWDTISEKKIEKYNINWVNEGDWIFVLSKKEFDNLLLREEEKDFIVPLYKNSDIYKYYTKLNPELFLINLRYTDRPIIDNYPNIKNHLLKYKDLLFDRPETWTLSSAFSNWFWYVMSTSRKLNFDWEKIVFPQRSKLNTFWYNEQRWYALSDCFFITNLSENDDLNIKYLLWVLNSRLIYFWLYNRWKRKWEYLELTWTPVWEIPIKQISQEEQKPFIDLVDQILEITKKEDYLESEDLQKQVKVLESRIDDMVYKLYELTPEEIELVEESLK